MVGSPCNTFGVWRLAFNVQQAQSGHRQLLCLPSGADCHAPTLGLSRKHLPSANGKRQTVNAERFGHHAYSRYLEKPASVGERQTVNGERRTVLVKHGLGWRVRRLDGVGLQQHMDAIPIF
jgi:hypothetical protein